MSEKAKLRASQTASENELVTAINSCGNCGRRIQAHQQYLEIYNTRHKGFEHYHESYLGCYESTRESGKKVMLDRWQRGINLDHYDVDGSVSVSIGWQL